MIAVVIFAGVVFCVAVACGVLCMRGAVRRWIAWRRVWSEQRRRYRERKVMLRYQRIGSGAWRKK